MHDISLDVYGGEILGVAGLVGAGRTELARAIFGADPRSSGALFVDGRQANIRTPADAIACGLGLVPEDRKQQALFLSLAIRNNIAVASMDRRPSFLGFIADSSERRLVEEFRRALGIRMTSPEQPVGHLSGGNQQKVVLARWLALKPKILIVDEPTRGIDVAAKAEVHQLLGRLAQEGIAVIVISSELPEVLALSDRIVTLCEGRLTGELSRADATRGEPDALDDPPRRRGLRKPMTVSPAPSAAAPDRSVDWFGVIAKFAPLIFLVLLMTGFAIAEPRFLSTLNLLNVLRQVSISGLLAIGMTFVILTAGIDLSIGSLLAFCGLVPRRSSPRAARRAISRSRAGRRPAMAGARRSSSPFSSASPARRSRAWRSRRPRCRRSSSRSAACRCFAARLC